MVRRQKYLRLEPPLELKGQTAHKTQNVQYGRNCKKTSESRSLCQAEEVATPPNGSVPFDVAGLSCIPHPSPQEINDGLTSIVSDQLASCSYRELLSLTGYASICGTEAQAPRPSSSRAPLLCSKARSG